MADQRPLNFTFPRWTNYLLPILVIGVLGGAVYVPTVGYFAFNPDTLDVGYQPEQPVKYSHALHVGQLGLDCRYCHNTVENADFAAIPPTQTCINCHNPTAAAAGVKKTSPLLTPVHESYASGQPIEWVKVHDLPDYVYFNHASHVNNGIGCVSCHGRVDTMGPEGVHQVEPLSMAWCLDCHRAPEQHLRPKDQVTNLTWAPPVQPGQSPQDAQLQLGLKLKEEYDIHDRAYMQACSTCHR